MRRLDGLQLARGLAACTVVIGHAVVHHYGSGFGYWGLMANHGVILFFVISGYIMVLTTGKDSFNPGAFMNRRIRRIVPIYWIANLILLAAVIIMPSAFRRATFELTHFVQSLLFIPAYDPVRTDLISPFFRLGWTLNYEMFFYLLFASLFALSALWRGLAVLTILGGLILAGIFFDFDSAIMEFYTRVATIGFIFGVLLGLLALYIPNAFRNIPNVWLGGAMILSIAMLAVIGWDFEETRTLRMPTVIMSIASTLQIIVLIAMVDHRGVRVPRALLYIGDASYSIYLFHMFAIGAVTAVAARLPEAFVYPSMAVAAVAGIASGVVMYWLVESPLNRFFRYRRPLTAGEIKPRDKPAEARVDGP